jgi:HD-GYP domain-containing protein (c-di-GMP phosphodiesterase class II)
MPESQGNAHVIPLLWFLNPTLEPIKSRLESLSYTVLNFSSLKLLAPPAVALIPISARATLEQFQKQIHNYQALLPEANTTYLGIYSGRLPFKIGELYRIGLGGIFQSPLEDELLINKIYELSPIHSDHKNLTLDQLIRVSIVEIEKNTVIPFDLFVYLPMNRKAILYLEKDKPLDEKTIKKFQDNQNYNLFIRRSDIKAYQDYGRKAVAEAGNDPTLQANEKRKAMASRIGQLMGGFFAEDEYSEDEGRQMLENLKAFTRDLRETSGEPENLEKTLTTLASQKLTHANHSQNVAAYCAYFGMVLGLTSPEALRLGGLLHDMGLAELPADLASKDRSQMTPAEFSKYKAHPLLAQAALERMKLKVPVDVLNMILHHHENVDGSGYPYGLKATGVSGYAKVCAFADEFDHLTSLRPGHPQLSPMEAVRKIAGLNTKAASPIFDKDFHKPLVDLFLSLAPPPAQAVATTPTATPTEAAPTTAAAAAPPAIPPGSNVPLSRLLKTPEFAKAAYLAELKFSSPSLQAEMDQIAEQLRNHFKAKRENKTG